MQAFYTDCFVLPLPPGHRFPMAKYAALRERVERKLPVVRLGLPHAAGDAELGLAHDPDYIDSVIRGTLNAADQRRLGLPWSPQLVERSRRSVGATIDACRAALVEGIAVTLAGGTHHAFRAHGAGFCVFNDSVVAARVMQAEGRARRIAVVDCDVHQGDGTASLTAKDSAVFTLSLHGANNYPPRKERSDLDVALHDGTGDEEYLATLDRALRELFQRFAPDLIIYLAGADPFRGDRMGRLALTKEGLAGRDRMVLAACRSRDVAVAVAMAGGYAEDVDDVVDIHFATVSEAARMWADNRGQATSFVAERSG